MDGRSPPGVTPVGRRAWRLAYLLLVLVLALLAVLADRWDWPTWILLLIASAGTVIPARGELREALARRRWPRADPSAALVTGRNGRLPVVWQMDRSSVGVRPALAAVPYVRRPEHERVLEFVAARRPVLVVGHPMAGSTRLLAEAVTEGCAEAPLLLPRSVDGLRELLRSDFRWDGVVVWLDGLDRFIEDGLDHRVLIELWEKGARLVATISTHALDAYGLPYPFRPPQLDVHGYFTDVPLRPDRDRDLAALAHLTLPAGVRAGIGRFGLAEFLGGASEAVSRYESGASVCPVGHALVTAAVDWSRAGMGRPMPASALWAAVDDLLRIRPDVARSADLDRHALAWATARINETVALLTRTTEAGYDAFPYLVLHVDRSSGSVPEALWRLVLRNARPPDVARLAGAALARNRADVAEEAWCIAARAGDAQAMTDLARLLAGRGLWTEAREWLVLAAERGHRVASRLLARAASATPDLRHRQAMADLLDPPPARRLDRLPWNPATADRDELRLRTSATAGDRDAAHRRGVWYRNNGNMAGAESWFAFAAERQDPDAAAAAAELAEARGDQAAADRYRAVRGAHTDRLMRDRAFDDLRHRQERQQAEEWLGSRLPRPRTPVDQPESESH